MIYEQPFKSHDKEAWFLPSNDSNVTWCFPQVAAKIFVKAVYICDQ